MIRLWTLVLRMLGAVVGGAPAARRRVATVGVTTGAVAFSFAVYGGSCAGCDVIQPGPTPPPTAAPTSPPDVPDPPPADAGPPDAEEPPELPPSLPCALGVDYRAVEVAGRSVLDCKGADRDQPGCFPARIVGGTGALPGEFPFAASLQTLSGAHFCGGWVYNESWIGTAAHCMVPSVVGSGFRVVVGRTDLRTHEGNEFRVEAAAVKVHADYDATPFDSDVAVIELGQPAGVPSLELYDGEVSGTATVIGWGRVREGGPVSPDLLKVAVPIVPAIACVPFYSHLTDNMFCADTVGSGSCQGDSGGALLLGGKLAGIVSHGRGCADSAPGVYADATKLGRWIKACAR